MRTPKILSALAAVALLLTACGSDGEDGNVTSSTSPSTSSTPGTTGPGTTVGGSPTGGTVPVSVKDLPEGVERTDYLTFANGATVIAVDGLADGSTGTAVRAIDGDPTAITITHSGTTTDVAFVYELPALTTFDRLAVPNVNEVPGNATFFGDIEVSGSTDGPDSGFATLGTATFEDHEDEDEITELDLVEEVPVRWVRVHLTGGITIEEGEEDKTNLEFSEIIGNGTQETVELSDAFTGIWSFKPADAPQATGELLQLTQNATSVTGCLGTISITGTVNGNILRATGIDSIDDRPSAYILLPATDGALQGVSQKDSGVFGTRIAPLAPEGSTTPCSDEPVSAPVCPSIVYINFDVDSADIRPDSEPAIDDLFERLEADTNAAFSIEGHTSTEGDEDYNLDLSERRAQSVVDALVSRGIDEATLTAAGKGETEPLITPESDESARALNRRVEIKCA